MNSPEPVLFGEEIEMILIALARYAAEQTDGVKLAHLFALATKVGRINKAAVEASDRARSEAT
jgi:hypothetical protein